MRPHILVWALKTAQLTQLLTDMTTLVWAQKKINNASKNPQKKLNYVNGDITIAIINIWAKSIGVWVEGCLANVKLLYRYGWEGVHCQTNPWARLRAEIWFYHCSNTPTLPCLVATSVHLFHSAHRKLIHIVVSNQSKNSMLQISWCSVVV